MGKSKETVASIKGLGSGLPSSGSKIALVYDLSMPRYDYRNEQGGSVTVDIKPRKDQKLAPVDLLANLALA